VKETLQSILPRLTNKTDKSHLDDSLANYRAARAGLDRLAEGTGKGPHIHPQYVARLISELAAEDAIFTCDVGTQTAWAARYLKMNGKRRLIGSFNHGSMANALLQAIGAQASHPTRQVVSMSGDGGFAMMMGDFITLSQQNLPVKVVLLNNGTLGFVELEMKAAGLLETGVDLVNPDFAAMAAAMGIKSFRVESPEELPAALQQAFQHPGPALVDVVTARQELIMPPAITATEVKGFSLFMLRAVMDGRMGQLINLAEVNLPRSR
jgi:pyruvate dehydrogenase (quinone)